VNIICIATFSLLIAFSYYIIKNNKNDYLTIGAIVGLVYFNMIPFSIFLLNDGTIGLNIEAAADTRWAFFQNISKNPEGILKYFLAIFFMYISIFFYTQSKLFKYRELSFSRETTITSKFIYLMLTVFLLMNIVKDILIPANVTHWAEKAEYFNLHYGVVAQVFNFFLVGLKYYLLVITTNIFKQNKKFSILILLLIAIIDIAFTANRIFALLVGMVLLILFVKNRNYKSIITLSIFSVPLILFMNLWPYIRSTMSNLPFLETIENSLVLLEVAEDLIMITLFSMTEGADFLVSFSILEDFPNKYNFFYGTSLLKIFTFFIPRALWENKWDSIAIEMAHIYHPSEDGFSLATTLLGEIFANGGFIALLIVPFLLLKILSVMFRVLKKISKEQNYSFLAFSIAFLSMRSNFSDAFLQLISISIFIILLRNLSKMRFKI
jgi:hypothetical protein